MFASLRATYHSLPRLYWTLWFGTLINKAGGFVVPFLALYITARGGSEEEAGLVMALYGGGTILAGFTGGVLADRVGRRAAILISLFGGAAAMLCLGLVRTIPYIGALTFLTGWLAELYRPAVSAAIADIIPAADRPRAYAHLYWVINLGFAIAPTLAGLVASLSYTALFVVDAATMALYGLLVLRKVPETRPRSQDDQEKKSDGGRGEAGAAPSGAGLAAVLRDGVFGGFLLLCLGLALVMWQNGTALPLHMKRQGIGEATYGWLMAENGVMIVFLQPVLARALSPYPRTWVLSLSSLLFGVGFGLYGVVHSVPGYALAIAIWTIGEIAALPSYSAVVADLAPAELRGRYQGLYSMSWGVASCAGPLIGGAVLARSGGRALWFGCFGLSLLVTVGHLLLGPARARRERRQVG
jgi:MFS family permease